jgi:hypothetical protein
MTKTTKHEPTDLVPNLVALVNDKGSVLALVNNTTASIKAGQACFGGTVKRITYREYFELTSV